METTNRTSRCKGVQQQATTSACKRSAIWVGANLLAEKNLDTSCIMHTFVAKGVKIDRRLPRAWASAVDEREILEKRGRGEHALFKKQLVSVYPGMIHCFFFRFRLVDDE